MRNIVTRRRTLHVIIAMIAFTLFLSDTTWTGSAGRSSSDFLLAQTSDQNGKRDLKDEIRKQLQEQKEKNQEHLKEMRERLDSIRKDIRERNLHFVVELNEMMKYKIAEITGAQVPKNIDKQAKVQSELGEKLWDDFMKKYREFLEKKGGNRDEQQDESKKKDEYYEDIITDNRGQGKERRRVQLQGRGEKRG